LNGQKVNIISEAAVMADEFVLTHKTYESKHQSAGIGRQKGKFAPFEKNR